MFYPTLLYALSEKRREVGTGGGVEGERERDAEEGSEEREPLLRE